MAATSLVSKCEDALWSELDAMLGRFATAHQGTLREVIREFQITGCEEEYSFKNGEHRLEWSALHHEITGKLERKLADWCERDGCGYQDLLTEINEVLEGKFVPLFEEHENKPFVDLVLSLVDYDSFLSSVVWKLFQLGLDTRAEEGDAAVSDEEGKTDRK